MDLLSHPSDCTRERALILKYISGPSSAERGVSTSPESFFGFYKVDASVMKTWWFFSGPFTGAKNSRRQNGNKIASQTKGTTKTKHLPAQTVAVSNEEQQETHPRWPGNQALSKAELR